MENVKAVKDTQEVYQSTIESLDTILSEKLLSEPLSDMLANDKLTNIQRSQMLNSYAYTLSTLYFILLKATGEIKKGNNQELIMTELNRVKSYITRVKTAMETKQEKALRESKAAEESKRFIQAQLNGAKYEPSVSKSHFQKSESPAKHIRFTDEDKSKVTKPSTKKSKSKSKSKKAN